MNKIYRLVWNRSLRAPVVAGATREHDSGYEVRMTAGGVKSVLDEALRVAPGLATVPNMES